MMVEAYFESSDFKYLKIQPFSLKIFLSEARDPLTHVPCGSTTTIPLAIQTSEISYFKNYLAPLDFIQSLVSGDAWLSLDQLLRTKYQYSIEKPQKKYSTP
jgi:hypothetical protein